MTAKIPFLRPNLVDRSCYMKYLEEIDDSNIYSNFGPLNVLFERRVLDEYFDNIGAVTTVANATLGLMLAISEFRRPTGRYALMPSFTFAAAPLAALWCGLEPYFIDVREDDWLMDERLLADAVEKLREDVAVVVPYATFGTGMDLAMYRSLHDNGTPVVVDAAASFGTSGADGQFGKGFPGPVIFSFHATKAFGIGEGGLVYSGDAERVGRIRRDSNFSFSADRESTSQGLNAKLSEYAAAVALSTLDAFPGKLAKRSEIYRFYTETLKGGGLLERGWSVQNVSGDIPFQFMAALCPEGQSNTQYVERLALSGIDSRTYFSPACHRQQQFHSAARTSMTATEELERRVISLPLWETMAERDVQRVVEGLLRE